MGKPLRPALSQLAVFGTIAGAITAWAVVECWRLLVGSQADRGARALWTLGLALMLLHSAAAFEVFYSGSHRIALAATARQTAALTGVEFGGGLYINYLFLAIWVVDCLWWWAAPRSYEMRPPAVATSLRTFFLFMFLNGAVLFADGWMRVLGAVAVAAVTVSWYRNSSNPSLHR